MKAAVKSPLPRIFIFFFYSVTMSLAGYFFGNVDEQGRLESDLDEVKLKKKKKFTQGKTLIFFKGIKRDIV